MTDDEVRKLAREIHGDQDEVVIDPDAIVSRGDDEGAYVQAWVWVSFITD